jgi:nucleoside-diphosphate-sugar epimerase
MKAIVTGAAGFLGANLVEELVKNHYEVIAVVRNGSAHNSRIKHLEGVRLVAAGLDEYDKLSMLIDEEADVFYHLAWGTGSSVREQHENIVGTLYAVEAASQLGCVRFVATGSQAEYGAHQGLITEETPTNPFTAYGAAKLSADVLSKVRAEELGIDWIWDRVFSVYGKYEPHGRMLPDMIEALRQGETFHLSACTQNWDYIFSTDAAKAVIATGERGKSGEIYNVTTGEYHPLRYFTEMVHKEIIKNGELEYDKNEHPKVSLQASADKIINDTGWKPEMNFIDGVQRYIEWKADR